MRISTKNKVIFGFMLVIVILAILAFFGVRTVRNTSALFDEYNRVADLSVSISGLEAAMNKAAYKTMVFAWFYDEAEGKLAIDSLENARKLVQLANSHAVMPERKIQSDPISPDPIPPISPASLNRPRAGRNPVRARCGSDPRQVR